MKFKVLKGSDLYKKLDAVRKRIAECNNAALDLVNKLGYKKLRGKTSVLAGGISSIEILGGKPEGWRDNYWGVRNEYFPKKNKANKELLASIDALPIVEYDELNNILNFNWHASETRHISFHPGIYWRKKEILISVSENYNNYKPVKGMIEILESEFIRKTKEEKKKQTV